MTDFAQATEVEQTGATTFQSQLSPDWEIWGPNGGYLATVALRAAGVTSERARPVSINVHFVGAGRTGTVDLTTRVNRSTKVATSVSVELSQEGRPWLIATVWGGDNNLAGLEHHTAARPDAPDPDDLPDMSTLMAGRDGRPHPFWNNLEQRPLAWIDDWDNREPGEPETACWTQFVPTATYNDPWIDAGRPLVLIDLDSWPATSRAHTGELEHYAPTIELTARFLGSTADEAWLLGEARSPAATDGIVVASSQVWTRDRRLVALGGSTLLCRPATRRPDRGNESA